MLANPYVLLTAAVVGMGAVLWKGVEAAGAFNHEFLDVRNLNLDKSNTELDKLKRNVLDLSLKTGLAAGATARAFYDLQSATGLYGQKVESIVHKVSDYLSFSFNFSSLNPRSVPSQNVTACELVCEETDQGKSRIPKKKERRFSSRFSENTRLAETR